MDIIKRQYLNISLLIFLYVFSWSGCIGLLALWLDKVVKVNDSKIGLIFGVNAICAIIIQPIYGKVMDKYGLKKHILYIVALISTLMYPFFKFVYAPMIVDHLYTAIILGGAYIGMGWAAGIAAFESYMDKFSSTINKEFGSIRMWGSLGWAAGSLFSGVLFNLSPYYNFILGSIVSMLTIPLIYNINIRLKTTAEEVIVDKDVVKKVFLKETLLSRDFIHFCFYVIGIVCIMAVAEQQFSRYFVTFFSTREAGASIFGYLSTLQCVIEFFMFFLLPKFVNKIGARNGLLLVGLIVTTRMLFTGLTDSYVVISILKPIYGIEISLLLVSTFKYISEVFDKSVNSSVYLIGYQAVSQVSIAIISPIVGYSYLEKGFGETYIYLSVAVLIFTLISFFVLSKKNEVKIIYGVQQ